VSPDRKVLTVSELTTQLREVLEERFPAVRARDHPALYSRP